MPDNNKLLEILGTEELVSLFNEMDFKLQDTILNKSFKRSAKLIQDTAKGNLRGYQGIKDNFNISFKKETQTTSIRIKRKQHSFMAYWVEHGTTDRSYTTKNGSLKRIGKIQSQKYFTRALKSTEGDVKKNIYMDIKQQFEKLIQKRNKL